MDTNTLKKVDAQYDGSINAEMNLIKGNQKQTFNIRMNRHYGFRVANGPVTDTICSKCGEPIIGQKLVIDGRPYHYSGCFKSNG